MKRNKNIRNGIIVAILLLAVGFATVSTTLLLSGSVGVTKMEGDFDKDMVFTGGTLVNKDGDVVGTATVENNGKVLSFEFSQPISSMDDEFTLNYTVKNNSDFDADFVSTSFTNIEIYETGQSNVAENPYISVEPGTVIDTTMSPEDTADGSYVITPSRAYAGDDEITYDINIEISATGEEVVEPTA